MGLRIHPLQVRAQPRRLAQHARFVRPIEGLRGIEVRDAERSPTTNSRPPMCRSSTATISLHSRVAVSIPRRPKFLRIERRVASDAPEGLLDLRHEKEGPSIELGPLLDPVRDQAGLRMLLGKVQLDGLRMLLGKVQLDGRRCRSSHSTFTFAR
jgi:hypothetical protein